MRRDMEVTMPSLASDAFKWIKEAQFPLFILCLQVAMLIMFGVLVEYDDLGTPLEANSLPPPENETTADDAIRTSYPRESFIAIMTFCIAITCNFIYEIKETIY